MKENECDYCLYLAFDEVLEEYYCTVQIDQDDYERMSYENLKSCKFFRQGDDYTIVRKQGQ